jgi:hypothetical protein
MSRTGNRNWASAVGGEHYRKEPFEQQVLGQIRMEPLQNRSLECVNTSAIILSPMSTIPFLYRRSVHKNTKKFVVSISDAR